MTSRDQASPSRVVDILHLHDNNRVHLSDADDKHDPSISAPRRKDEKCCAVCGDHAVGFNFGAIACESCKAFFRRNALRDSMSLCLFNNNCLIQVKTRRFCSPCRITKCFAVGMRKSCIMDEKAKLARREKILRNRERRDTKDQHAPLRKIAHQRHSPPCTVGFSSTPEYHHHHHPHHHQSDPVASALPLRVVAHSHHQASFYPIQHLHTPPNQCGNELANQPTGRESWSTLSHDVSLPPMQSSEVLRNLHSSNNSQDPHEMTTFHRTMDTYCYPLPPPRPSPLTSTSTNCETWLQTTTTATVSTPSSAVVPLNAGPSVKLPCYVKKSNVVIPAPNVQLKQANHGNCESSVKNVLDGHVWTSEPEEPSNKECIALSPEFLKTGLSRLLSKDQWTALNDLRSAYETSFLDSASDHAPANNSNLTLSSLVNTSGFLVRKFINFAQKLADFSVLVEEGQICLLKGVVLNALIIRSASHYNVVKDVWMTPKGEIPTKILKIATGAESFYEEHAKYCRDFANVVNKDSHLVALMQVLCLFAPDRPRLSDRQSVSNIYDRYILLLKHYLEARHGFTRGRTLLAAVLTNLAQLQALTDNYGHILLHVDPSKVDPLILEVFSLSDKQS